MVIYQKQHRLAHRQYCALLSESRLTRFPPPSKKAFFPSSHIFRVNIKRIIKTLFPSKCGGINFGNFLRSQEGAEGWSRAWHAAAAALAGEPSGRRWELPASPAPPGLCSIHRRPREGAGRPHPADSPCICSRPSPLCHSVPYLRPFFPQAASRTLPPGSALPHVPGWLPPGVLVFIAKERSWGCTASSGASHRPRSDPLSLGERSSARLPGDAAAELGIRFQAEVEAPRAALPSARLWKATVLKLPSSPFPR